MATVKYAFRCKSCGTLERAEQAGEREYPAACPVCGHGVTFDPLTGVKTYEDEANWLRLADASDDELAPIFEQHGIDKGDINKHKPIPVEDPSRVPQTLNISADDTQAQEDVPA